MLRSCRQTYDAEYDSRRGRALLRVCVKGHDVKECPRKMSSGRCRNDEHCTTMDEAMCVGHFVVGLRSQSSALVTVSDPTSWTVAVALARKCENTLLAARLLDSRQVSQKPSVENEKFQLETEEPVC